MGLFDTIKNAYQDKKAAEQAERDFVYGDKGTEAICAYMKTLFDNLRELVLDGTTTLSELRRTYSEYA